MQVVSRHVLVRELSGCCFCVDEFVNEWFFMNGRA